MLLMQKRNDAPMRLCGDAPHCALSAFEPLSNASEGDSDASEGFSSVSDISVWG